MLPALLVMLATAADGEGVKPAPAPLADTRARDTAALGMITAIVAAGLAAAIPLSAPQPGATPLPLYLGTTAFVAVAFVRPVVFFSGQPSRPKPTALNNTLRVIGTLTALLGLVSFVAGFATRPSHPDTSAWAMVGAAGLEGMSAAAFSIDAFLGLP
jgi:hypothetical protein